MENWVWRRPGSKAGSRTEDGEEGRTSRGQVRGHDKGNERAEQGRLEGRVEGETEGRERWKKPSTWFMHKQSAGRKEGQGQTISTGKVEGSICGRTEGSGAARLLRWGGGHALRMAP